MQKFFVDISEKYFGVTDIEDVVLSHVTQTDPDSISISQVSYVKYMLQHGIFMIINQ